MIPVREVDDGVIFAVKIHPRAKKSSRNKVIRVVGVTAQYVRDEVQGPRIQK